MCIGRQIWDEKGVGRIKEACSLGVDVALRFVKTGLGQILRRKKLTQVGLQERWGWRRCVLCRVRVYLYAGNQDAV